MRRCLKIVDSYFFSNQTCIQNRVSFSNQLMLKKVARNAKIKEVVCSHVCKVDPANTNAPFRSISLKIILRTREALSCLAWSCHAWSNHVLTGHQRDWPTGAPLLEIGLGENRRNGDKHWAWLTWRRGPLEREGESVLKTWTAVR